MGDRILAAVAGQLLSAAPGEGALPARDRANVFLLWLPGATASSAVAEGETLGAALTRAIDAARS